jgi:hypothetical protein
MVFTLDTNLTPDERRRKRTLHKILTGNGTPEKYEADAAHVFEAGKYGRYFITVDNRILAHRDELEAAGGAIVVTPTEWLAVYDEMTS